MLGLVSVNVPPVSYLRRHYICVCAEMCPYALWGEADSSLAGTGAFSWWGGGVVMMMMLGPRNGARVVSPERVVELGIFEFVANGLVDEVNNRAVGRRGVLHDLTNQDN
jgi:hypothetical protein